MIRLAKTGVSPAEADIRDVTAGMVPPLVG